MNKKIKSVLSQDEVTSDLSKGKLVSKLSKENIKLVLAKIPAKHKLFAALSTIPFIATSTVSTSCATTCPYGMLNDPFPGQCSRYMDISGDGFCDLSQATPVATTDTSTTDASASTDTTTSTTDQGHGNGANAAETVQNQPADSNTTTIPDSSGLDSGNLQGESTNYYILPVTLLMMGGYLFTYYLFKKGILKRNKHRRIWNLLVTVGYLGTGFTGIILTLMVNLGIRTALNPSITFWHAELAILMVVGTLIHLHMYWKPFKNMFKVLFGFNIHLKRDTTRSEVTFK